VLWVFDRKRKARFENDATIPFDGGQSMTGDTPKAAFTNLDAKQNSEGVQQCN
jgi:hypothetical protein